MPTDAAGRSGATGVSHLHLHPHRHTAVCCCAWRPCLPRKAGNDGGMGGEKEQKQTGKEEEETKKQECRQKLNIERSI